MSITPAKCACGQVVVVRTHPDAGPSCRRDKKVVHYPEDVPFKNRAGIMTYWDIFRCRSCGEPIADTCPEAAYDKLVACQ